MASLFEAYITNLGKYNEGELVGETLKFPTTTEEVQALLKRIGVDGVRYEEFFITSFDGDVLGLYDYLTEYENLDELNHLACLLSELDQGELEKFEAVIDSGEHTSSVADLINLAQNLDCYEFYPGVEDDETLGRIYVEDMEAIDVPEHLLNYFDYEAYGRDIRLEEDGHFAPGGYVLNNGGQFIEHYHGIEDIPDEHKVFAFPQLTVREQMAAYKEIIDGSSLEGYGKAPGSYPTAHQFGPHPYGNDLPPGGGTDRAELSALPVCRGLPGVAHSGVCCDLCGADPGNCHGRRSHWGDLGHRGLYGFALLHAV